MTDASSASSFADERLAAHRWAADLAGLLWPERLRRVQEDRTFAAPSFIELSISLGRDFGFSPLDRRRWAQLAVEAAVRGRSRRAAELEPLAWAVLGTAHRVLGDLSSSGAAFRRCQALRHRIRDPLEFADSCWLQAVYCTEVAYWLSIAGWAGEMGPHGRRALVTAAELIDEALRLAAPRAEPKIVGSYEITAGTIARRAGRKAVAMTMVLSAMGRIDSAAEPRLGLIAGHNAAVTAADLGHLDAAMEGLLRLQRQYDLAGDAKVCFLRERLAAGLAWAQGHLNEAEDRFRSAREQFAKHQMLLEVADANLSIARMAAAGGRSSTAERLVARASRLLFAAGSPFAAHAVTRLLRGGGDLRHLGFW